jgi:RNA polymerase sigma-70 factor (ECF subfamily)
MREEAIPGHTTAPIPAPRDADHEAELVRRAKERSPEAWTLIYERHYDQLFRYVQARVGEPQTAEDLTSTVFVEALKSIRSYTSRGHPLLAWLYVIARNVVNYHYRSHFRRGGTTPAGLAAGEEPAQASGPAAFDPASAVESWDLQNAVRRLSGEQREAVVLRYFVGLTTPEVARVLGKHERAVYSLQARAIKALRRYLS